MRREHNEFGRYSEGVMIMTKALENDTEERIRELVSEKDDFATLEIKGRAEAKGLGDVIIPAHFESARLMLRGNLTFVARWVRSDSITDRTEEFYLGKESDDGAEEKQDSKEDQRKADEADWSEVEVEFGIDAEEMSQINTITRRFTLLSKLRHYLECPTFWRLKPAFTCPVCACTYRCYWDGNDVGGKINVCKKCTYDYNTQGGWIKEKNT